MKKNKKSLLSRLFASNIFLLILSFVLAFVSWIVVSFVSDTNIKPTTIENVPVSIDLPESDFNYTFFLDNQSDATLDEAGNPLVSVNVKGNAIVVGSLKPENFKITGKINISNDAALSPHEYTVSLNYEKSGALTNYEIVSITPQTLTVFIDQELEKEFDIVSNCTFKNADNTKYPNMTLSQSKVKVSGPETMINEIASVEVHGEIVKEGTVKKELIFKNSEDEELPDYYFTPSIDSVEVTAKLLPISTVNLKVDLKNIPDDVETKPVINPSAVKIAGEQEELDKYENGLTITSLDFTDLKNENFKQVFTITPPDNCKIIADEKEKTAPTKATVSLDLGLYKQTSVSKKITYAQDGYTYVFSPGDISVTIYGDEDEINDITSNDIKLIIDFPDDFKSKIKELKSAESVSRQNIKLKLELDSGYTQSWIYGQYTVDEVFVTKV